jgi:peptide/nickel transport system permease protein
MTGRMILLFVIRRLIAIAVLLVIISFAVFTLLYASPGSIEQILLGTRPANPQTIAAIRAQYHLDDPFIVQYLIWAKGALHLDFGTSVRTAEPVLSGILNRLGVTMFLGVYGFTIAMLLGVPLGIASAVRKRSFLDRAAVGLGVVGVSAPAFASGIYLLFIFAVLLGWFPVFGVGDGFVDSLWHFFLPAVTLALTAMALVLKLTRAAMIDALDQDYVVFARARGIPYRRVLTAYAFRNALVPVVTGAGAILGYMLTGAVLVEVTFALPGIGLLLVDSVTYKDVPMVQAIAMLIAIIIILVNLATDITYVLIDPRIRFSRGAA